MKWKSPVYYYYDDYTAVVIMTALASALAGFIIRRPVWFCRDLKGTALKPFMFLL